MLARRRRSSGGEAWDRAVIAVRTQLANGRISDERLTNSAFRLSRSHERLSESEPRVKRGRQRKV